MPRRNDEKHKRDTRRLRGIELLNAGKTQAEVARQLGVSFQAVSVWAKRAKKGTLVIKEKKDTHVVSFMIKLSPKQHEQLAKIARLGKTTKVAWIRQQIEATAKQLEETR